METNFSVRTADVAVDSPAPNLYTYLVPSNLAIQVGQMVQVPFGARDLHGYVMSVGPPPGPGPYKNIRAIIKAAPLFGPEFLGLVKFVSQYYRYPIGLCVKEILPGGLAPKLIAYVSLTPQGEKAAVPHDGSPLRVLQDAPTHKAPLNSFPDRRRIYQLEKAGLVAILWEIQSKGLDFAREWYLAPSLSPPNPTPKLGPKAKELWDLVKNAPPTPLSHYRNIMADPLTKARGLEAKGLIVLEERLAHRDDPNRAVNLPSNPVDKLTPDQEVALKAIAAGLSSRKKGQNQGYLLFGVTGSGKTEVYLRAAALTLTAGLGVLWLAPEIALTLGLEGRLKERFPLETISVLHSGLTQGQRHDHWGKLVRGESRLALGARSAVFAPIKNLGLIVVDEEHDWAFKQEDGLRYQGRDLAAWRARDEGAVLLLGSATPSLETFKAAQDGRIALLKLTSRPGEAVLPPVTLVDRRTEKRGKALSSALTEGLTQVLARGEQALLFLNRRGLSSLPLCLACGQTLRCPHCSLTLTLHGPEDYGTGPDDSLTQTLICHGCGYRAVPVQKCPHCSSPLVRYLGVGTEKLLKLVEKEHTNKVLKLDADSVSHKGGLKSVLEKFGRREADVLIGTQMAAKGHDFPYLTLVGVVEADLGLNAPDFRAAERTFQLLSQVSGRAGRRDRPGQVLIQTLNPDHYALQAAKEHDYEGFYAAEIEHREKLGYPPFGRLALIRLSGPEEKATEDWAEKAAQKGRDLITHLTTPGLEVLGPAPAPIARLRDRYRFQILVRAADHPSRSRLLGPWLTDLRQTLPKTLILTVDVDPYHMM